MYLSCHSSRALRHAAGERACKKPKRWARMRVPDIIRAGVSKEELPMRIRSFAGIATGLAAAFIVLAGCTVVEERPGYRPSPPPRPGPVACTREYAPVCGERRGQRQTFANACMARADGYSIVSQGACRSGGNTGGGWNNRPGSNRPEANRPGTNRPGNNRPETNRPGSNRPEASRPGSNRPGSNRPGTNRPDMNRPAPSRPGGPQACTREYAPVCARSGRDTRTFSNACEAQRASYRVLRAGSC